MFAIKHEDESTLYAIFFKFTAADIRGILNQWIPNYQIHCLVMVKDSR